MKHFALAPFGLSLGMSRSTLEPALSAQGHHSESEWLQSDFEDELVRLKGGEEEEQQLQVIQFVKDPPFCMRSELSDFYAASH